MPKLRELLLSVGRGLLRFVFAIICGGLVLVGGGLAMVRMLVLEAEYNKDRPAPIVQVEELPQQYVVTRVIAIGQTGMYFVKLQGSDNQEVKAWSASLVAVGTSVSLLNSKELQEGGTESLIVNVQRE